MEADAKGTFVIPWSQTEVDGERNASPHELSVGATWLWTGTALRVDGPQDLLRLEGALGAADIRKRASRIVPRLTGRAAASAPQMASADADPPLDRGFIVTDGRRIFRISLLAGAGGVLLRFEGSHPPRDEELWVVRVALDRPPGPQHRRRSGGVICFTPDTRLRTPTGARMIRELRPGDLVLTKDNGPQAVLWAGQRRVNGARLHAMPHLRPIRFRTGALGIGRPDGDLLVSPQHRMLVKGAAAQALFNTPEVLVTAADLVNGNAVRRDHALCEVTYVHILLERHNIVWANGLETESFHPAHTALDWVEPVQRAGLLALLPGIALNPDGYGEPVRRNLAGPEAAILRHDLRALV